MTRICFVGAGSVVFTTQLLRDLLSYDDLGELHIALHDIDADRLETARLTAEQVARRLGRPVGLSAHTDRRAALEGVDVAITMIQVGGLAATKIDFEVPARFGLRQTIGDTLGVGGVFRALRTFPVPVSYTHLDVYKRQALGAAGGPHAEAGPGRRALSGVGRPVRRGGPVAVGP